MKPPDHDHGRPLKIRSSQPDPERSPDIQQVDSIVLKDGERSRKEIVHYAIRSRNTGEFKGHKIGFNTQHRSGGRWQSEPSKSFALETEKEISSIVRFILAACKGTIPNIGGQFLIIPAPHGGEISDLQRVLATLSQKGKANLLVELLDQCPSGMFLG